MSASSSSEYEHLEFTIVGTHSEVASASDIAYAIHQAKAIFHRHSVDPLACLAAIQKLENDELLNREEALLCLIWDEAEEVAFKSATIGWLSRDVDLRLCIKLKVNESASQPQSPSSRGSYS